MEETWTVLKVLQWTTGYFSRKGIEQPRSNAEVLLAHILGLERIQLYLRHDQPLTSEELARFREVVRRRADKEPTQYITSKQEFWSLDFEVTSSVLIPRPETELLVEKAVELLPSRFSGRVLDLCTGSGAIAIALAHECHHLRVFATDKSPQALAVAKRNAIRHHVEERVMMAAMDLLDGFSPSAPLFDLVISNPPYVGEKEFCTLAPEVACHEPAAALRGGGELGLDVIQRIIRQIPFYLKPGGALLMEIGQGQAEPLGAELDKNTHVARYEFIRDYSGILRVLHLLRSDR
jgi:release factor glutamine methyltransferase